MSVGGPRLVVGTAGHIDHGKSTLVTALTGVDPDRLKEEKARGITIELGFAHAQLDDVSVAFVDVPGHERFVRTMLAGVGGIDAVLLVVAADESVMPQTREHFDICRLLQVRRGLVVLTKADAVDADLLAVAADDVRSLVEGSFLEGAPILPVSAVTGDGLEALRRAIAELAGQAARDLPRGRGDAAVRLSVDRVFTMKGFGQVATGTLVSGVLRTDDPLVVLPTPDSVKVRGLQVHGGRRGEAFAGERVAVNVGGDAVDTVRRGVTLASPGTLSVTRRVDVELTLLADAGALAHGTRVRVHHGTAEVLGRVSVAGSARAIESGTRGWARVRLEAPAVLTRGDRLVVRTYSPVRTVGGAVVLDPEPGAVGVRTDAGAERLARLAVDAPVATVVREVVGRAGIMGMAVQSLVSRLGVAPSERDAVVTQLCAGGVVERAGDRLVSPDVLATHRRMVLTLVAAHHRTEPLAAGLPREEARTRVCPKADVAVFEYLLSGLVSAGQLVARDRLALPTHAVAFQGDEARVADQLVQSCRDGGLTPPDLTEVASKAGMTVAAAERVAGVLVRQGALIRLDGLYFHPDALERLKVETRALKAGAAGARVTVDVAGFKARYGMTRKFAIPLLEYLDRERVTRRMGDVRVVL